MSSVSSQFRPLPFGGAFQKHPMRAFRVTLTLIFAMSWILPLDAYGQSKAASSSDISIEGRASVFAALAEENPDIPLMELAELTASDGLSDDWFGEVGVAISGNTVVVGLAGYSSKNVVYVFEKPADGWSNMTQVAELTPSDGGHFYFGGSVIAVDGDTVAVSGYSQSFVRAAYVYVKPSTGWTNMTETAQLSSTSYPYIGSPVAIRGNIVLAADYYFGAQALVYVKPAGGWQTVSVPNATLTMPSEVTSMAISPNGTVVLSSAELGSEGSAYVFLKPQGGWKGNVMPAAQLVASDPTFSLGLSVAIDDKGDTVVAGADNGCEFCNDGAVYVFVRPSRGWANMTQTAKLKSQGDLSLGASVAIDGSGQAIVAGAPLANVGTNQFQGAVYLFLKPPSGWKSTRKFSAEFTASNGAPADQLGSVVAIFGETVVAGAPFATVGSNLEQGAAYVFGK